MIISKMNKNSTWYIEILIWCRDNAIVWTSLVLGWKALDLGFKYLKDGREQAIRSIVQDEINKGVSGKLDHLSEKIEMLGDAVLALKTKI